MSDSETPPSDSDALVPERVERETAPAKTGFDDLLEDAAGRGEEAEKDNTRRAYRRGREHFAAFCEDRGAAPLPATPESVVAFIEGMAQDGYALPTIDTRLAAIKRWHEKAGHEPPTEYRAVRKARENIRDTAEKNREVDRKAPLLMEHLRQMEFSAGELSELRDRAVLFVGFAGGFRRSELVGLEIKDMTEAEGGIVYRIRDPKESDEPATIQVPDHVPGLEPTPNEALRKWLQAAGIDSGPLFRMVDRWGNVRDGALSGYSVNQIVKERIGAVGEDPSDYGAHSLRAGFATQAYMDGIGEHEAAAQTRHSSLETLREYQRVNVVMEDHPLTRMGTGEE
ncbi:site-specific integrase [Salinibacter sp.]|uniref:site-specific integrase n=1 Tax=Salinibacter sp. TaxID=2065818 RepID=UPI0021E94B8A|nr:tyrosine-type recombinase/integrase [Salinibacter sp.]